MAAMYPTLRFHTTLLRQFNVLSNFSSVRPAMFRKNTIRNSWVTPASIGFSFRQYSDHSAEQWESYGVSAGRIELLHKKGIKSMFPVQVASYNQVLEGKDLIVKARTGTGKTLAFGVPLLERLEKEKTLERTTKVIIVVPTRELAIQAHAEISGLSDRLAVACVYGGAPYGPQERMLKAVPQIVVGTPGRMYEFISRGLIETANIETVVLDEADTMLDQGFQDQIESILSQMPAERQTLLFSATVPQWVRGVADKYLKNPKTINLVNDEARIPEGIKHYYVSVTPQARTMALRKLLPLHCAERAIVFVSTQQTANEMGMGKIAEILDAQALHGGMRQSEREVVMKNFREGLQRVLIATDVAARGIDVPNVDCVIHFDTDLDSDKYVHRAGRCGRAGKDGVSIILANHNEKFKIRELEKSIGRKIELVSIPDDREVLHSVMHRLLGTLLAKKADTYAAMVPYAKEILKREDSEQLISAALASITGYDKMSEYSLLSGIEGKITIQLKKTKGFFTVKSAIYFVKEIAGVNTQVNHVSISEEDKSIFLDVNKDIADLIMLEYNSGTLEELTGEKGVEVHLPNMLPALIPYEPEQHERSFGSRSGDRGMRGRGGGGFSRSDDGRPRRQQRDDGRQQRDDGRPRSQQSDGGTHSRKRFNEYENMPYRTRERKHHIVNPRYNK